MRSYLSVFGTSKRLFPVKLFFFPRTLVLFAIRCFSIVVIARTCMLCSSLAHKRNIQEVTMVRLRASVPAHLQVIQLSRPPRFGRQSSFSSSLSYQNQPCALFDISIYAFVSGLKKPLNKPNTTPGYPARKRLAGGTAGAMTPGRATRLIPSGAQDGAPFSSVIRQASRVQTGNLAPSQGKAAGAWQAACKRQGSRGC